MAAGNLTTAGMVREVAVAAVIVAVSAVLGLLVHPLLWSIAVLAVAWLLGRNPYSGLQAAAPASERPRVAPEREAAREAE